MRRRNIKKMGSCNVRDNNKIVKTTRDDVTEKNTHTKNNGPLLIERIIINECTYFRIYKKFVEITDYNVVDLSE